MFCSKFLYKIYVAERLLIYNKLKKKKKLFVNKFCSGQFYFHIILVISSFFPPQNGHPTFMPHTSPPTPIPRKKDTSHQACSHHNVFNSNNAYIPVILEKFWCLETAFCFNLINLSINVNSLYWVLNRISPHIIIIIITTIIQLSRVLSSIMKVPTLNEGLHCTHILYCAL